jgi:hypothetical protein
MSLGSWGTGSPSRITRVGMDARARNRSTAQGLELAVENRGQTQADQDRLRRVTQMDLHLATGELFNPLHPGQPSVSNQPGPASASKDK